MSTCEPSLDKHCLDFPYLTSIFPCLWTYKLFPIYCFILQKTPSCTDRWIRKGYFWAYILCNSFILSLPLASPLCYSLLLVSICVFLWKSTIDLEWHTNPILHSFTHLFFPSEFPCLLSFISSLLAFLRFPSASSLALFDSPSCYPSLYHHY